MKKKILAVVLSFAMIFTMSSIATFAAVGTAPINLGTAGGFTILSKTGVTNVPDSVVVGNIGVSPISGTAIIIMNFILGI